MALSRFYESFRSNSYSSSVCCICCPRNDCVEEDCLWCRVCDVSKNLTLMLNDFQLSQSPTKAIFSSIHTETITLHRQFNTRVSKYVNSFFSCHLCHMSACILKVLVLQKTLPLYCKTFRLVSLFGKCSERLYKV